MVIGILTVEIEIPQAFSLKEKRGVLNRIRDRVRNKFNAAVAEVGSHEVWNLSEIGVAVVSTEQKHANQMLSKIAGCIENLHDFVVVDYSMEFIHV